MKPPKFVDAQRSAPLNRRLYARAGEVRVAVREIAAEIIQSGGVYKRPPSKKAGLNAAVQLLVLNFLRLRFSDPKRVLAAGFRKLDYASGSVSYLHMKRARDGMIAIGLVVLVKKHFFDAKSGEGSRARYQATQRLFEISIEKHKVRPSMILVKDQRTLVQLRGEKPKTGDAPNAPWPKACTVERKTMTSNLRKINQALRESLVALHVPDATLDRIQSELGRRDGYIDFFDKDLYRVFNDGSPHLGGRFFGGWWQNVPREYRKFIHIIQPGTWATYNREIDYSGIQPRILYAKHGLDGGNDLYTIPKYDAAANKAVRHIVKMLLLQMLNAESEEKALKAARSEIIINCDDEWSKTHPSKKRPKMTTDEMLPKGCPPLKQLMDDIKARHQPIAEHFCSDAGKSLMYADSTIAEAVMLRMIDAGVVVLPIHDSFIVRREFQDQLRETMRDEFRKFTGFEAPVKWDESELEAHKKAKGPPLMEAHGYLETNTDTAAQKRHEYSIYTTLKQDWMATDKRTHPKLMTKGIPNELYKAPFERRYYSARRN